LIISVGLNLIKQIILFIESVFVLLVQNDKPIELVSILPIQIAIPLDTFKQHVLRTLFQPKVQEMEIDKTLV
jgi:hypothetical protein